MNKNMQIYVAIDVLETVTIFNCSSVGEAVTEIISFHGEIHIVSCQRRPERRAAHPVLGRKCCESGLLPVRRPRAPR